MIARVKRHKRGYDWGWGWGVYSPLCAQSSIVKETVSNWKLVTCKKCLAKRNKRRRK